MISNKLLRRASDYRKDSTMWDIGSSLTLIRDLAEGVEEAVKEERERCLEIIFRQASGAPSGIARIMLEQAARQVENK